MNQACKVCGEPAAGFHFGAFTCEGCKSFFGRSYNNLPAISDCKNANRCTINKKNRTSCKSCRLRKCLLVGMSKSGSRYGRRSNWFKIHCLLEEQQNQADQNRTDPDLLLKLEKFSNEKFNNNNSSITNKNISPQISPKSPYEERMCSLSPHISPRTFGYSDPVSPSLDVNMNYYSMFPQILLANNYHYYKQIKYGDKQVKMEEDDEADSDRNYSGEYPYSRSPSIIHTSPINIQSRPKNTPFNVDILPKNTPFNLDILPKNTPFNVDILPKDHHSHRFKSNAFSIDNLTRRIEGNRALLESFESSVSPLSDSEQDVPIDLSVKSKVKTNDNYFKVKTSDNFRVRTSDSFRVKSDVFRRTRSADEDSDVDITTYGSDEETIDVTTVHGIKPSPSTLQVDVRR